ncbi:MULTISPECIES: BrnA antitoxin family protein [Arsenophonus]|uniref:BrnA antitoxin family protein n=1 Tax=Arsenophonus TaxID=637 RepID=UPI0015D71AC4|nr:MULTISPECIES: BrnA antitoxin family protein [Arsenophonus]UBX30106.1 BrnA antitoxin family protein [Arsenophonus apicola]
MKKVTIKQNALPTLTDKRKAELKVLAGMPESEINFSDIPPMDEVTWQNAHRGNFYRPIKQHASVRIDADVLAWLRGSGKGYQTRLNAILRAAMLKDLNNKR